MNKCHNAVKFLDYLINVFGVDENFVYFPRKTIIPDKLEKEKHT